VNASVKIASLAARADSIDDMDLLRHGAMPVLCGGIRAPSTLGSFLRSFTWGNVLQLQKVHRQVLAELARRSPHPGCLGNGLHWVAEMEQHEGEDHGIDGRVTERQR
jgi:hypothetical protein